MNWRYYLLRLMGWRPAVAHNLVVQDVWLAGTMQHPYLVDRDGNRVATPSEAE